MGGAMKLFLVLAYVISRSFVNGQWCADLPSLSTIEADFRLAVNASGSNFILREIFYNCIAYGSPEGSTFRETRITARYQAQDGGSLGQALYGCVNISGNIVWVSDDFGVVLKTGLAQNGTERCMDCRALSSTTCTVCPNDCDQGDLNSDCSGCVCHSGYTGPACNTDINECQATPPACEGGGTCANFDGGFNCTCPEPCTGGCNACCSSPCTRGGTCSSNSQDDFTCQCPTGHTGKRCQDFQGGCLGDPCTNGGICNMIGSSVDQYRCSCPVGFTGVNCETEIDNCIDNPCRNQGWCSSDRTGYTCTCLHGFTGSDCGQPLLTCSSNPTACGANGECTERTVDGLTIKVCSCNPGYIGETCNIIVDSCTNNTELCFHGGTCVPASGGNSNVSFSCNCSGNWTGFYCTECSLKCGGGQPDARCTVCVCNDPNANNMCNPTVDAQDPNANTDNSDTAGIIAGSVVGGFAIVGLAVVMVTIAIYFIVQSSRTKKTTRSSWIDSELNSDPFAHAKESSIPRFSGPVLGGNIAFGKRQSSLYGKDNSNLPNELSGNENTS